MPFGKTDIPGLLLFEPVVFDDTRGSFFESWNEKTFNENGVPNHWVQDNQSYSVFGVIRGLHYQLPPFAQAKLVRVLRGKILDVIVDIRKESPAYGKVYKIRLSAKNKKQLYIPPGLAHGFSVLSEKAEVLYKCDNFYSREHEAGILFNDPILQIDWEIPAGREIVSEKDLAFPLFENCTNTFEFKG